MRFNQHSPNAVTWQSPLHYAIRKGDLNMTQLLVNGGSNVNLPDRRGLEPWQLASHLDFREIADYLRLKGAIAPITYSHSTKLAKVAEANETNQTKSR